MNKYSYNGPVLEFDKLMEDNYKAYTQAPTESKARSNIAYQWKKRNNRLPGAKVTCPGKLTIVY